MSYPIAALPIYLQYASVASPLTWSVEGFRGFLMNGMAFSGAVYAVFALIVVDVIFLILGIVLFKRTERYVRKKGALSQF